MTCSIWYINEHSLCWSVACKMSIINISKRVAPLDPLEIKDCNKFDVPLSFTCFFIFLLSCEWSLIKTVTQFFQDSSVVDAWKT